MFFFTHAAAHHAAAHHAAAHHAAADTEIFRFFFLFSEFSKSIFGRESFSNISMEGSIFNRILFLCFWHYESLKITFDQKERKNHDPNITKHFAQIARK